MKLIFDIKPQDLRHKVRLVVRGHVVDSSEHTTYLSAIKDIYVRTHQMIAVKTILVIMAGDIENYFCTALCA